MGLAQNSSFFSSPPLGLWFVFEAGRGIGGTGAPRAPCFFPRGLFSNSLGPKNSLPGGTPNKPDFGGGGEIFCDPATRGGRKQGCDYLGGGRGPGGHRGAGHFPGTHRGGSFAWLVTCRPPVLGKTNSHQGGICHFENKKLAFPDSKISGVFLRLWGGGAGLNRGR